MPKWFSYFSRDSSFFEFAPLISFSPVIRQYHVNIFQHDQLIMRQSDNRWNEVPKFFSLGIHGLHRNFWLWSPFSLAVQFYQDLFFPAMAGCLWSYLESSDLLSVLLPTYRDSHLLRNDGAMRITQSYTEIRCYTVTRKIKIVYSHGNVFILCIFVKF